MCAAGVIVAVASSRAQETDSLDIKIGQMLLIGFAGPAVDQEVLREVREGKVGSVIMFEKNIPAENSFFELKKILWTYQKAAPVPLLIAIDQEGGRVNRLKDKYGFPRTITAAAMGEDASLDSVRFYSEATAATLAGLGINVNFAPVVDLASNPDNPVIARYGRAFSPHADTVALMAMEVVKAHRRFGVITALKHFPGHGSSKSDTHLGIADVTNTWEEDELKPYQMLIDSGYADAVMSAHIVNRNLEPDGHPGTLSDDIITGILRERLNYDGVVFSDDMQMHAITKHYGLEEAIRMAIQAGIDVMTFSNNISGSDERTVAKVHGIIRGLVESGAISRERIDESYRRVMALKQRLKPEDALRTIYRELQERRHELNVAEAKIEALERKVRVIYEKEPPLKEKKKRRRRKN